jgi:hypothetical protein
MQRAEAPLVTDREKDAPEVTSEDKRRLMWWGILLGLLALGLSIVAALLVSPSPTRADPVTVEGCTVQLTGEAEGPLPGQPGGQATLTFTCDFEVDKVLIEGNKEMLVVPIAPDGTIFVCPPTSAMSAECASPLDDSATGTFQILAQDVCGVEDDALELDVTLTGAGNGTAPDATINDLEIQCEQAGGTTTTPTTTTGPGTTTTPTGTTPTTTPGGTGTTGTGTCPTCARQDSGAFPKGGVQTGAGGTA